MEKKILSLIFVYNADSGIRNAIMDSVHKILSPSTYECNLCDISYGIVGENSSWKKFRKVSQHRMEFLHRDEFQKEYASKFGHKFSFPIVLVEGENGFEVLVSTSELNQLKTTEELIGLIEERAG